MKVAMPLDLSVSGIAKDPSIRSGRCSSSAASTPNNKRTLGRAGSSSSLTLLGMSALNQDPFQTSQVSGRSEVSGRRTLSGARISAKSSSTAAQSSLTAAPPSARRSSSTSGYGSRPPSGKKIPVAVPQAHDDTPLTSVAAPQDEIPLIEEPATLNTSSNAKSCYPSVAPDAKPGTVRRATEWNQLVEDAYRLQFCGYKDVKEYESHWGTPERWPADEHGNTFICKVQLKGSGHFTYWRKFRECEDKNVRKVKLYS